MLLCVAGLPLQGHGSHAVHTSVTFRLCSWHKFFITVCIIAFGTLDFVEHSQCQSTAVAKTYCSISWRIARCLHLNSGIHVPPLSSASWCSLYKGRCCCLHINLNLLPMTCRCISLNQVNSSLLPGSLSYACDRTCLHFAAVAVLAFITAFITGQPRFAFLFSLVCPMPRGYKASVVQLSARVK